jgi:hypothetical protein
MLPLDDGRTPDAQGPIPKDLRAVVMEHAHVLSRVHLATAKAPLPAVILLVLLYVIKYHR